MWPGMVIMVDHLMNFAAGLLQRGKGFIHHEVCFEDAVDPFGNGVFERISILGHADEDAVIFKFVGVVEGAVLQAAIGMMNQGVSLLTH